MDSEAGLRSDQRDHVLQQGVAEVGHKISVTETGEVIFQGGQNDLASDPDLLSLCDSMT